MEEGSGMMNPKAMARAKRAASHRGRSRTSHNREMRATNAAKGSAIEKTSSCVLDIHTRLEELSNEGAELDVPTEQVNSKGWDYGELLSQRTIPLYQDVPGINDMSSISLAKGLDSLRWNFEDLYDVPTTDSTFDNASYLTLDLRLLSENLAQLGLAQRLFLEEEILQMGMISSETDMSTRHEPIVAPTEAASWTSNEDRDGDFEIKSRIVPDMFSEDSMQVSSISNVSIYDKNTLFATSEQAILVCSSSAEDLKSDSTVKDGTAEKGKQSIEALQTSIFTAKAAEAELDALLDMLENQTTVSRFDRNTEDALSSSSQKLSSSSQAFWRSLKHEPVRSNTKPLTNPDMRLTMITSTLPTFSNATHIEGGQGAAALGSSEDDFDAWLDSI